MTDLTNHYINQQPPENNDPGCFAMCAAFIVAMLICAFITVLGGCSHPKEVASEISTSVTTSQTVVDSSNHVVTVTKSDTTVTEFAEYSETEITFTTTDYDSLGNTMRVTSGNITKRADKRKRSNSSSSIHKKDSTRNYIKQSSDSTRHESKVTSAKTKPKPTQKALGWAAFISSILLFLAFGYSIYLYFKKS